MTDGDWTEIVLQKDSFDLNTLINEEFLKRLNDISDDKEIDCINLSFIVRDREIKIEDESKVDVIRLQNNSLEDTLTKTIFLNTNFKIDEIKNILDEW